MTFRMNIDPNFEDYVGLPIAKVIDLVGDRVLANAERLVPIETRALQDALTTDAVGTGADRRVAIGADPTFVKNGRRPADYILHVEKGTSVAPAQPFLKPALYQTRGVA